MGGEKVIYLALESLMADVTQQYLIFLRYTTHYSPHTSLAAASSLQTLQSASPTSLHTAL